MSQSKVKAYRRTVERTSKRLQKELEKTSNEKYRQFIFTHMDNLCKEPFQVRFHFMWLVLLRINPHTGKKVRK